MPRTKKKGDITWPTQSGKRVKLWGRRLEVDSGLLGLLGLVARSPPVSTMFLAAMMISISQS